MVKIFRLLLMINFVFPSDFSEGHLNFSIKIPANISFQIGIIDSWGNQSYVDFPSNQTTYGLVRDGNWGQASIPGRY